MVTLLTVEDMEAITTAPPASLQVMIEDVTSRAVGVAPCLEGDLPPAARAEVVAILRGAVLRWAEHATRDDRQMTAGPFTVGQSTMQGGGLDRRALLWPSEVQDLQRICGQITGARRGKARMGWLA